MEVKELEITGDTVASTSIAFGANCNFEIDISKKLIHGRIRRGIRRGRGIILR